MSTDYLVNPFTGKFDGVTNEDSLSAKYVKVDQTTPQTITGGVPLMSTSVDSDGSQNQIVNKAYVDLAVSSTQLTEFFHDEADALGGLYYVMDVNPDTAGTVVSATLSSSPQNIFNFITPVDHPHLDRLLAGVYDCHAHLLRTNATGNRVITCYYELYKCNAAGGDQVLVTTSANTGNLSNSDAFYDVYSTVATEVVLNTTDRLILKWYATTVSGTGNTTVTMTTGGTVDPHFGVKVDPTELNQLFVPYTGATHDTDTGAYDITATDLNCTNLKADHIGEKTGSHSIVIDNNWTALGKTCANGGTFTTIDINGGTIDGCTITGDIIGSASLNATKALDNLASVAFNADLLPGTANVRSVGGTSKPLLAVHLDGGTNANEGTIYFNGGTTEYIRVLYE